MNLTPEWLIATLAFTYIVTQSTIFAGIRQIIARAGKFNRAFIYCPACVGFWAGLASALALGLVRSFLDAGLAAGAGMLIGALWSRWGPEVDVWSVEQGHAETAEKKENDDG